MVERPAVSFGGLLRQLRTDAGLTQEDLAAAAGLSARSVSDLALANSAPADARPCYEQALAIATSIAFPLEQARALEGIGRCHLRAGTPGQGATPLHQALAIYQRIGSPCAQRVETTPRDYGM